MIHRFKKFGLIFSIVALTVLFIQSDTLTREIRLLPAKLLFLEFNVEASTQLVLELPVESISNFQISNGMVLISGRVFSFIAEEQDIRFDFDDQLLIASLTVQQDQAQVMTESATKITDENGQLVNSIEVGDILIIENDVKSVRSFSMNAIRLTGHFDVLSVDTNTGESANLLELDTNTNLDGKLIFRPLILGN